MRRIIVSAVVLLALASPGYAKTFKLTIENDVQSDLTRFTVKGGKVEGFRTIGISGVRKVTVTLPDGVCRTEVRLKYADDFNTHGQFDFCKSSELTTSYYEH